MPEKRKKIILTVKQNLKLIETFENGELATKFARLWDRDTNRM
jgi:hypothetical protein